MARDSQAPIACCSSAGTAPCPASPGGRRLERRQGGRRPLGLGGEALGLGQVPRRLACRGLERAPGGPLRVLGPAAIRGGRGLGGSRPIERGPRLGRGRGRARRVRFGSVCLGLERLGLACQPVGLGPTLERRVATADPHGERVDDRLAVPEDREPPERERRLDGERRLEVGHPDDAGEQRPDRARRVATDGVHEPAAGRRRERVVEATQLGRGPAAGRPIRRGDPLPDDDVPALGCERACAALLHEVRPGQLAQRRLDGRPQRRLDAEVLVHARPAEALRGAGDAAILLLGPAALELLEPSARAGEHRAGSRRPLRDRPSRALGGVGGRAGRLPCGDRRALGRGGRRERPRAPR